MSQKLIKTVKKIDIINYLIDYTDNYYSYTVYITVYFDNILNRTLTQTNIK